MRGRDVVLKLLGCTQRHFDSGLAGMLSVEIREEKWTGTYTKLPLRTAPHGQIYIMQAL